MIPPFKRPVRMDGDMLVAADQELIQRMTDATDEERAFIVTAINGYLPNVPGRGDQRKLGRIQRSVLHTLKTKRFWHQHTRWGVHNHIPPSSMAVVMEALLRRGLVAKTEHPSLDAPGTMIDKYEITYEGEQCDTAP